MHFFDRNGISQAAQPHSVLNREARRPLARVSRRYPKPGVREDKKGLPRDPREPKILDLVDRIPDQEEAAVAVEANRSTKVGAELAAPQAGCCK